MHGGKHYHSTIRQHVKWSASFTRVMMAGTSLYEFEEDFIRGIAIGSYFIILGQILAHRHGVYVYLSKFSGQNVLNRCQR